MATWPCPCLSRRSYLCAACRVFFVFPAYPDSIGLASILHCLLVVGMPEPNWHLLCIHGFGIRAFRLPKIKRIIHWYSTDSCLVHETKMAADYYAVAMLLPRCGCPSVWLSVCLFAAAVAVFFFAAHSQKKDGQVQGASSWASMSWSSFAIAKSSRCSSSISSRSLPHQSVLTNRMGLRMSCSTERALFDLVACSPKCSCSSQNCYRLLLFCFAFVAYFCFALLRARAVLSRASFVAMIVVTCFLFEAPIESMSLR